MKPMPSGGYTIFEVLIVLTVSSALLISAMTLITGQDEKKRFTQSVATFELTLQDIFNDVSTGYYPSPGDFACSVNGTGTITFAGTPKEQGGKVGCTFMGKAVELGPSVNYNSHTIVGKRDATGLADAGAKLLGSPNPGVVDKYKISADVEIVRIVSKADSSRNVTGVALISDFSQTSTVSGTVSGNAARVTMYEVVGSFATNAGKPSPSMQKADSGVVLCLQQGGGTGRKATVTLGTDNQSLKIQRVIDSWPAGSGC